MFTFENSRLTAVGDLVGGDCVFMSDACKGVRNGQRCLTLGAPPSLPTTSPTGASLLSAPPTPSPVCVVSSAPGGWGGFCDCPDGERYAVGDNHDSCGSLACAGCTQVGSCNRYDGAWSRRSVECTSAVSAVPYTPGTPTAAPPLLRVTGPVLRSCAPLTFIVDRGQGL
eukprot:gene37098-biopygen62852